MNPIKIAIGIVLGLFCWNYLIAWLEKQDRMERAAQLDLAFKEASTKCDQGNQESCSQVLKLGVLRLEQLNEDLRRQH